MNVASALIWTHSLEWKIILTYLVAGFPFDLVHAAATVIFVLLAAEPMLEKLDRIKVKYGLVSHDQKQKRRFEKTTKEADNSVRA